MGDEYAVTPNVASKRHAVRWMRQKYNLERNEERERGFTVSDESSNDFEWK
jgi:hypothetical protein